MKAIPLILPFIAFYLALPLDRPRKGPQRGSIPLTQLIEQKANQYDIPLKLVNAVIKHESNFDPLAERYEPKLNVSSIGLMQVLEQHVGTTCKNITVYDLYKPSQNLDCGLTILKQALSRHASFQNALIEYNGGPGCFKSKKCLTQANKYAETVYQIYKG